ncbi:MULTISPECIES: sulfite exporter TauE/SafE family protein [Methanobacterium]|jgi:ABC-type nickel/cobalt efflux system permease component RcnA|uniref:Nickel/cobalt efflux system n=1 Tax=Methanobacterium veterum TaxID=408577 RepID=A0A9E5A1K3_9EURY|nr:MULTISPECIES: sulfite exporter TauE/SafE family protein [Methanobacterium]MCZ3367134.1 sulfite exporter TauE/SafE family protein [Methanobacterium veterum]MCZ3373718.1 sulfite exporter TauE/SafE family protein [Methanobacterium veterum]
MNLISGITAVTSEMSLMFIISAFILGALHALEPGHGKSVMAAFVIGTDAELKDASLLGLTVVFSHVIVVVLLGIVSIFLIGALDVNRTHEVMSLIGGIILVGVGLWMVRKYYHPHHHHEHSIDTKKGVVAIGLSTGLIPCPAALAVLLFSIANNQLYNGLVYVLIFSAGLAISITILSALFVKGRGFIQSYMGSSAINKIPLLSGTIIIVIGLFTLLQPVFESI